MARTLSPLSMAISHPGPIVEFKQYIKGRLLTGLRASGQPQRFVFSDTLTDYWTDQRINQLLLFTFSNPIHVPNDKIRKSYLKTLSILVCMDKPGYIQHFITQDLDDHRLPHLSKPQDLPVDQSFMETFMETQWQFCPLRFCPLRFEDRIFMRDVHPDHIMPVKSLDRLTPETQDVDRAVVYKAVLHSERGSAESDNECTVTFKTYHGVNNKDLWKNEVNTFNTIENQNGSQHLIRCLGSFQTKNGSLDQYTIILEYANGGTLLDMFEKEPPLDRKDRQSLYSSMFKLLLGLCNLHGMTGSNSNTWIACLHLDIKPSNILVFRGRTPGIQNYTLKLADFGFSPRRQASSGQHPQTLDTGGTQMYSAPECCRDLPEFAAQKILVGPEADVWSYGCTFSQLLVWSILGKDGLLDYDTQREAAIRINPDMYQSGYAGSFHSGTARLNVVDTFHRMVEQHAPAGDNMTKAVSDIILQDMLAFKKEDRSLPLRIYRRFKSDLRELSCEPDVSEMERPASTGSELSSYSALPPDTGQPQLDQQQAGVVGHVIGCSAFTLPIVTIADVNDWRGRHGGKRQTPWGRLKRKSRPQALPGSDTIKLLTGRDHYFIVDDSQSMASHRDQICATLQALSYLTKGLNWNGVKLSFISNPTASPLRFTKSSKLVRLVRRKPMTRAGTMQFPLAQILSRIVKENISPNKPVNLYILTNGNWGPNPEDLCGMDRLIGDLVYRLQKHQRQHGFLGVQLIRFGNDIAGIERLRRLDRMGRDGWRLANGKTCVWDIVDHCSFSDSVWKMLIGSLDQAVDQDDESEDNLQSQIPYGECHY